MFAEMTTDDDVVHTGYTPGVTTSELYTQLVKNEQADY